MSASSEKEEPALQDIKQTQDFSEEPAQEGKLLEPQAPWKEGTVTTLPMTVPGSPETCIHSQGLAGNLSSTTKAGLFTPEQHESGGEGGGGALRAEAKGH